MPVRGLPCILGWLLFASHADAQNLLANGDFDTDLSEWMVSGSPTPMWTPTDYAGNAGSGSALIGNADAAANVRLFPLRRCVVLTPGPYLLSAHGLIDSGQSAGRLVLSYSLRSNTDCSGGVYAGGGVFVQGDGSWRAEQIPLIAMNLPANSLEIILGIEKDPAGGTLQGYFDGIELRDDRIFVDGFDGP